MRSARLLAERFWSKVDQNGPVPDHMPHLGPCWVWTAGCDHNGYGELNTGSRIDGSRRMKIAHRVAWYLETGKWPRLSLLHRCDNPKCVRPSHLFEGTQKDNMGDCRSKGRYATGDKHGLHLHPESRCHGERNGMAKLTAEQAQDILRRRGKGETGRALAHEFGVSPTTICTLGRKRWSYLNEVQR
jgi:hypothetical protein